MSIIGPRPQTQRCFDAFPARSQEEIVRVRPGLSGIGSIIFRDEEELKMQVMSRSAFTSRSSCLTRARSKSGTWHIETVDVSRLHCPDRMGRAVPGWPREYLLTSRYHRTSFGGSI